MLDQEPSQNSTPILNKPDAGVSKPEQTFTRKVKSTTGRRPATPNRAGLTSSPKRKPNHDRLMRTNFTTRTRRNKSAFTLIEIVLVLAIIALLLGAAIFKLTGVFSSSQKQRVAQDLSTFKSALNVYRMNAQRFPSTEQGLKALVEKPTTGIIPKSYEPTMKGEQLDPWGNPYGYRYPGTHNKGEPDIWSFGPDMIDGTDDDIGNWEID